MTWMRMKKKRDKALLRPFRTFSFDLGVGTAGNTKIQTSLFGTWNVKGALKNSTSAL